MLEEDDPLRLGILADGFNVGLVLLLLLPDVFVDELDWKDTCDGRGRESKPILWRNLEHNPMSIHDWRYMIVTNLK